VVNIFYAAALSPTSGIKAQKHKEKKCKAFSLVSSSFCGYNFFAKQKKFYLDKKSEK